MQYKDITTLGSGTIFVDIVVCETWSSAPAVGGEPHQIWL